MEIFVLGTIRLLFSWPHSFVEVLGTAKDYTAVNAETEKLWNAYFSDPDHWWDNRAKKVRSHVASDSGSPILPCLSLLLLSFGTSLFH